MLSAWSRHLVSDEEAKKKFEDMVKGSKLLTDRLQEILRTIEANIEIPEIGEKAFENPNWAYKQAYINGQKAALRTVRFVTETETNV